MLGLLLSLIKQVFMLSKHSQQLYSQPHEALDLPSESLQILIA